MGRFDFTSPGGVAGNAVAQYFAALEQRRRMQEADQLARDREGRLGEQHKANIELQRAQLENTRTATEALAEARRATATKAAQESFAGSHMIGDAVSADDAKRFPGLVATSPVTQGAQIGEEDGVPLYDVSGGTASFKGTPEQRQAAEAKSRREAFLKTLDPNSPQAQYLRAQAELGDDSLPYQLFQGEQTKPVVRVSADRRTLEQFTDGKWMPVQGEVPKDAHFITEAQPNGGEGGRPFVIPVQTAQGVMVIDGRTGQPVNRFDLKPDATAAKELANGETIMWMMDQMTANMTPEKIGPVMGRFKSVEEAITGGDQSFSALASQTAQLQNVVINLRTGAAMSEPEAARIMAELPSVNLPPETYLTRLKNAQNYYKQWQQNRARGAYGRTTTADVDRMVGGGAAPGVVAPGAPPQSDPLGDLYSEYLKR